MKLRGSSWASALALLHDLQELKLLVNEVIYGAAISACEKSPGRWPEALELLRQARGAAKVHKVAFSAAISACEKGAQWLRALEIFMCMPEQD